MKYIAILTILLSTTAFAQEKPTDVPAEPPAIEVAPAQQPATAALPAPSKVYYLEVDQDELNSLSAAINELPKRIADRLVMKLNAQLSLQAKLAADYSAATTEQPKGKKRPNSK